MPHTFQSLPASSAFHKNPSHCLCGCRVEMATTVPLLTRRRIAGQPKINFVYLAAVAFAVFCPGCLVGQPNFRQPPQVGVDEPHQFNEVASDSLRSISGTASVTSFISTPTFGLKDEG